LKSLYYHFNHTRFQTHLYGFGVIPILPQSTLSSLPLIVLPSRSASPKRHRAWNYISVFIIDNQQMNVIRSQHVDQDHQFRWPPVAKRAIGGELMQILGEILVYDSGG
jgi:hypothetical protein